MRHDRFQRFTKPTFNCDVCGRRTRLVGQGNDELCNECYELFGLENLIFDQCSTLQEIMPERDQLFAKAVKLGGDPDKIKQQFTSSLWPV